MMLMPETTAMNPLPTPGRTCPLNYHYGPEVFHQPPSPLLHDLEVLYVVGGLYGNDAALHEILRLFDREAGRKRLVFNGDFHWFDVDPLIFDRIQLEVLAHTALRGNVETELAQITLTSDAGCGCAYPDWVSDAVVERSNRILHRLWRAATLAHRQQLATLPMWLTATVGNMRIGIVHGDAESLAGWGFAQEHLNQAEHKVLVQKWFELANVDAFASSHTCLPVFQRIPRRCAQTPGWVFNNGAAGMPNFRGDTAGLLTRIAVSPFLGTQSRVGVVHNGIHVDALEIETDPIQVQQAFLAQWPAGSEAHASYFERIVAGPDYHPNQVIRLEN
jgi:hypothetical protein